MHNVFKLGQLLLADAGEQLPAHGDDAALDLIEQRLARRGQGDDAGPLVLAAAMALDQPLLLELTQGPHQGGELYLQGLGQGLLAEVAAEAAEFPQGGPAGMGEPQRCQLEIGHGAPEPVQSPQLLGEGEFSQHLQILFHDGHLNYLACEALYLFRRLSK